MYLCIPPKNFPNKHRPGWHLTSYGLGQERFAGSWWSHQPQRDQRFHGGNHRKPQQPKIGYVPTHEAHTKLLKENFREISSFSGKETTAKNPWHVWVILGDLSNLKSLPFGVAATNITRIQPYEFRVRASWNGYVLTGWYRLHNSHHQINDHRTCRGKTSLLKIFTLCCLAAYRKGYRVTSLHAGNGWATLSPCLCAVEVDYVNIPNFVVVSESRSLFQGSRPIISFVLLVGEFWH